MLLAVRFNEAYVGADTEAAAAGTSVERASRDGGLSINVLVYGSQAVVEDTLL